VRDRARTTVVIVAALTLLAFPHDAWAAPGDVDLTFGFDGVATDFSACGGSCTDPADVTVLADGRLLQVGSVATESLPYFGIHTAALTFTDDGTFDGYGFAASPGYLNAQRAVAPLPDGGAVTAGWGFRCLDGLDPCTLSRRFFLVASYLSDGSPNPAFDDDGAVLTYMGPVDAVANGVAVQDDGKIVVAGGFADAAGDPSVAVVRYLADGSRDPAFGVDGRVILPGGTATDVEVTGGGKIVVAGQASPTGFLVDRLLPDGSPDPDFGVDGRVVVPFGDQFAGANDVVVRPAKILLGGWLDGNDGAGGMVRKMALVRLLPSGEPDAEFHDDGRVLSRFPDGEAWVDEVVVTDDFRIVAAGSFGVARFLRTGRRDRSFGEDGRVWLPWRIEGVTEQGADVVVGIAHGDYGMALARILL
jgi:uncharacterized delta-60 repeat protein